MNGVVGSSGERCRLFECHELSGLSKSAGYSNVEEFTQTRFVKKILQTPDFELPLAFEQGMQNAQTRDLMQTA